jgi:hypothetical protein
MTGKLKWLQLDLTAAIGEGLCKPVSWRRAQFCVLAGRLALFACFWEEVSGGERGG